MVNFDAYVGICFRQHKLLMLVHVLPFVLVSLVKTRLKTSNLQFHVVIVKTVPQKYVLKCVPHVQHDYFSSLTNDIIVLRHCRC